MKYHYKSIFVLSEYQFFKKVDEVLSQCIACAPATLNNCIPLACCQQGKGTITNTIFQGFPPLPSLLLDPVNIQSQGGQLICQRIHSQLNQQTLYIECFNWVNVWSGRSEFTRHKKLHGNHFGTNSVFNLNRSYCYEPRMSTCHILHSKFFLISADNSALFSRKIHFNYHNLIKSWTAPQKEKMSFSELHGPAGKWAGCYSKCEAMCTPTAQMFFIKYHIITRFMVDKIRCITFCKAVRQKFQHKESKGWELSVFPLGWFSTFPKQRRGRGEEFIKE